MKDNDKSTVVSFVVKELRKAILDGALKGGDRIIQDDWAEKLQVSRMPIREALTQLQAIGLVEVIPHKGAIVNSLSKEDIEEIYSMRMALEGLVVEKAMPFITEEDKKELGKILEKMENLEINKGHNELYINLNNQYHTILRKRSPWVRLKKAVENLGISPIAPSLLHAYYDQTQREHRMIYEAVCRGNAAEARSAIEYHVLRTKNNLLEYMEMNDNG